MLVIKIELHPHGMSDRAREIGRMVIANVGGTDELGDYEVKGREFARRYDENVDYRTSLVMDDPMYTGTITGHAREREPVWSLVAKALYAIGFDKFGRRSCPKHWGDADDICSRPLGHDGPCGGRP